MRRARFAVGDLVHLAESHGWQVRDRNERGFTLWRWVGGLTMTELRVIHDPMGRVQCWSEWTRTRLEIDCETGRRARLVERLEVPR